MAGQLLLSLLIRADGSGVRPGVAQARDELGQLVKVSEATGSGASGALARGLSGLGDAVKRALQAPLEAVRGFGQGFVASLAPIAGVIGGGALLSGIIRTNREFEALSGQLETATGSAEAGRAAFLKLEQLAATTPDSLAEVVEAYVRLKNLGIEPTEERLLSFGNTASAMGKTLEQFVEAAADASVGEFERLKEFGIKASQQGDSVKLTFRGVTTELSKNSDEIVQYLQRIGDVEFAGNMTRQMERLPGLFSNFGDTMDMLARKVGEGGLNAGLADLLRSINGLASGGDGLAQALGQGLGGALSTLGGGIAKIASLVSELPPGVQDVLAELIRWTPIVGGAAVAAGALGLALAAITSPLALIAAAIVGGVAIWSAYGDQIKAFLSGPWEALKGAFTAASSWLSQAGGQIGAAIDQVLATYERLRQGVLEIWQAVVDANQSAADSVNQVRGLVIAGLTAIAEGFVAMRDRAIGSARELYEGVRDWLASRFGEIVGALGEQLDAGIERLLGAYERLRQGTAEAWQAIADAWMAAVDRLAGARDLVLGILTAIADGFVAMRDRAIDSARELYEGVYDWLVGRFDAVVSGITAKIDAVTGAFRAMYTAVVGGSYVPDMVTEVGQWFGRLDGEMVEPATAATSAIGDAFRSVGWSVSRSIGEMVRGGKAELADFVGFVDQAVGRILDRLIQAGFDGVISGIGAGIGSLLGGGTFSGGAGTATIVGGGGIAGDTLAFAVGGQVPRVAGSRAGRDSVPAMLTPGEHVIRPEPARRHRGLLEAINAGLDVQYFASGGAVAAGSSSRGDRLMLMPMAVGPASPPPAPAQVDVQVKVNVDNRVAGAEASVQQRRGPGGEFEFDVILAPAISRSILAGHQDKALGVRFGVRPVAR